MYLATLNRYQALKVVAGGNAAFGEVWWFYPAENSDNNDRYVVFNYEQKHMVLRHY
jgi:hypothetical protein